ncbi:hypothetical protein TNCV_3920931 [Trichonephila clavipes]|nr:hypothetical protein TNCV_3920931 [Trichonephila clavipes]
MDARVVNEDSNGFRYRGGEGNRRDLSVTPNRGAGRGLPKIDDHQKKEFRGLFSGKLRLTHEIDTGDKPPEIVMASKRKHSTLTLKDKLEVLKRLDKGEGVTKLATEFNVGKASVGDINEWMEEDGKQPNF